MNEKTEQMVADALEGGSQGDDAKMLASHFKRNPDDLDSGLWTLRWQRRQCVETVGSSNGH